MIYYLEGFVIFYLIFLWLLGIFGSWFFPRPP